MKSGLSLLVLALAPLLHAASLDGVRTVYLLPMANGLDQYLANKLTGTKRFQVVTDPAQADAVFTDRLGVSFETRMEELYPIPKPVVEKPIEKKEEGEAGMGFVHEPAPVRVTSFGRSRGNLFLVDKASKRVIWSHYKLAKSSRPSNLNKLADSMVDRLEDDVEKMVKVGGSPMPPAPVVPVVTPTPVTPPVAPVPPPPPPAPAK